MTFLVDFALHNQCLKFGGAISVHLVECYVYIRCRVLGGTIIFEVVWGQNFVILMIFCWEYFKIKTELNLQIKSNDLSVTHELQKPNSDR